MTDPMNTKIEPTEKKTRIIVTAKNLFFEKGFANTSMNLIQEKAKISKGLIYYHFKDKDTLGLAVFQHVMDNMFFDFDDFTNTIPTEFDRAQIMEFLDNYLDSMFSSTMQDQSSMQIIFDLLLNLKSPTSKQRVRELYLGYTNKISKFLEFMGVEQPTIHAKLVISILDGLMYLNMALGETLTKAESPHIIRALKCLIQLEDRV